MSSEVYKSDKHLCRCCHSKGKFQNIYSPQYEMDVEKKLKKMCVTPFVYADILRECYNIELIPVMELYQHMVSGICDGCIIKLKDANIFKQQVLRCEAEFRRQYNDQMEKDFDVKLNIKQEVLECEVYCEVEAMAHDDLDDRINMNNPEDAIAETKVKIEVKDISYISKRQYKTNKKELQMSHNVKPKRKVGRPRKMPAATKDGEALDIPEDVKSKSKTEKSKNGKTKIKETTKVKSSKATAEQEEETNLLKDNDSNLCKVKTEKSETTQESDDFSEADEKPLQKNNCLKKLLTRQRLFKMRENIDYKKVGDLLQCCRCELTSSNKDNLRSHVKFKHLNYSRYKCHICSETFMNTCTITKHKFLVHNIDERSKCNACDRAFYTKNQLKCHISCFHMLGEKNKCTECDYENFSIHLLRKHMMKHKAVKDFHCKYCNKSFLRKTTLQFHERIHTGDKRKVCKVCGDAFVQKASLNYHMTRYHPGVDF